MVNPGSIANVDEWWDRRQGYYSDAGSTQAAVGVDVYRHVGRVAAKNQDQSTSGNRPTRTTGGLSFNPAQSDFITLPSNFLQSYTTGFTFAAWVFWNGSANWQYILEVSNDSKYFIFTPKGAPGGTPRGLCFVSDVGGGEKRVYTGTDLPIGIWQHVALILDGTNGRILRNGVEEANMPCTILPSQLGATTYNWLGKSHFGDPYFNGIIGENAFYNRALSNAEAGQIYSYNNCGGVPLARYVLPTWKSVDESLFILQSDDARIYNSYACVYSGVSSVRDPSLFYHPTNRLWYVCHTSHGFGTGSDFAVASSALAHDGDKFVFSGIATVDCSAVSGTNRAWGPKWFIEWALATPIHTVTSLSSNGTTGPFVPYEQHPTNSALTTWSAPAQITGTALPANIIDGSITKYGSTYYFLGKNETTKYPFLCSSSSPFSGYDTLVRSGDFLGVGQVEGLSLINMGTFWQFNYDDYVAYEGMKCVRSYSMDLATCGFGSEVAFTAPFVPRNGVVIDTQAA